MKFKSTFKIEYTAIEVEGNVNRTTKWYSSVEEIPAHYFGYENATLVSRVSVDDNWVDILKSQWEQSGKSETFVLFEAKKVEEFLSENKACFACE